MERCPWPNLEKNQIYIEYHDKEWGIPSHCDHYLFEMFLLETFHCGLSWFIILKKREAFRLAFSNFDYKTIATYNEEKVVELMKNSDIVRNERKILATIENAKSYIKIIEEFGSFSEYLWGFVHHKVQYFPFDGERNRNKISDSIAKDLKKRGFSFMGTVTCYSYLEAVGIFNNHSENCDLFLPIDKR